MSARRDHTARRPEVLAGSLALIAALGLAYGALGPAGLYETGLRVVVDHAFSLLAVVVLFVLTGVTGRTVLGLVGFPLERPPESIVFSVAVGAGVVGTAVLGLGAVGLLHPALLWGLLSVSAAVAWRRGAWGSSGPADLRPGSVLERDGLLAAGGMAVLIAVAGFLTILALTPPADWDTLMYHLRVPAQFVDQGRIFLPEDNLHVTRIGLGHMLYVPLLGIGLETGPALASAAFAVLTGLAGFALADRFLGRRTAWASLVLVWGSTTILIVAITPRVDVTVAFYAFLAHYAVLVALEDSRGKTRRERIAPFVIAGALLGFAVGVKLQAALYAVALGPVLVWAAFRRSPHRALVVMASVAAVLLLVAAPWLVKNVILVGSPLYPALSAPRLEPWLTRLYGHSTFPTEVDPKLTLVIWELRERLNPGDFFLHPERLAIEQEAKYYFGNPALLLLPLAVFVRPGRVIWSMVIPALLYLAGLLLLLPEANLRYLIPAWIPLTLVAVHGAVRILAPLRASLRRGILFVVTIVALLPTGGTMVEFATRTAAPGHAIGIRSGVDYLRSRDEPPLTTLVGVLPRHESLQPSGTRTLMLFEARGYPFETLVVQDNRLLNWPLLARSPGFGVDWCPADAGFSHVLVNLGALNYYRRSGLDPVRLGWPEFERVRMRCLVPVFDEFGLLLFRDTTHVPAAPR